jgi:hypothetical protein
MDGMMYMSEQEQVRLVESGTKPVAMVPSQVESALPYLPLVTYTCVLDPETDIIEHVICNNERIYYRPETEAAAKRLQELMKRREPQVGETADPPPPHEWHAEVGRLLGYSDAEIAAFE